MKAHIGLDSRTKFVHWVVATAANIADMLVLPELSLFHQCSTRASDCTNKRY